MQSLRQLERSLSRARKSLAHTVREECEEGTERAKRRHARHVKHGRRQVIERLRLCELVALSEA